MTWQATGGPTGHPLGERTRRLCAKLEDRPSDIHQLAERMPELTLRQLSRLMGNVATLGLIVGDKTCTPIMWSARPDWRTYRRPDIKQRKPLPTGKRALQSIWGSVVGQSVQQ